MERAVKRAANLISPHIEQMGGKGALYFFCSIIDNPDIDVIRNFYGNQQRFIGALQIIIGNSWLKVIVKYRAVYMGKCCIQLPYEMSFAAAVCKRSRNSFPPAVSLHRLFKVTAGSHAKPVHHLLRINRIVELLNWRNFFEGLRRSHFLEFFWPRQAPMCQRNRLGQLIGF